MAKEYKFNDEGVLEIQQIRKCDLAFFYNSTPQSFRKELEKVFITSFHKKNYSCNEVEKIFAHFGYITRADVENAQERIEKYLKEQKERYKKTFEKKWAKESL